MTPQKSRGSTPGEVKKDNEKALSYATGMMGPGVVVVVVDKRDNNNDVTGCMGATCPQGTYIK